MLDASDGGAKTKGFGAEKSGLAFAPSFLASERGGSITVNKGGTDMGSIVCNTRRKQEERQSDSLMLAIVV